MQFNSEPTRISQPPGKVYAFAGDMQNFEPMMPEQIENFSATSGQCKFSIPGMGEIELQIADKIHDEKITYVSAGKTPIKFSLALLLDGQPDYCTATFILSADLNPMMAILAKTPLQNFVNLLSQKLKDHIEGSPANASG